MCVSNVPSLNWMMHLPFHSISCKIVWCLVDHFFSLCVCVCVFVCVCEGGVGVSAYKGVERAWINKGLLWDHVKINVFLHHFTELQEHSGKVSDLLPVSLFSVVLNPNPQQHWLLNVIPEPSAHCRIQRGFQELWSMWQNTWATWSSESGRRCRRLFNTVSVYIHFKHKTHTHTHTQREKGAYIDFTWSMHSKMDDTLLFSFIESSFDTHTLTHTRMQTFQHI